MKTKTNGFSAIVTGLLPEACSLEDCVTDSWSAQGYFSVIVTMKSLFTRER